MGAYVQQCDDYLASVRSRKRSLTIYTASSQSVRWFLGCKKGCSTCARAVVGQVAEVRQCHLCTTWMHIKFHHNRPSGSFPEIPKRGTHVRTCSGMLSSRCSPMSYMHHLAAYQISSQSTRWFLRYQKGVRTCARAVVGQVSDVRQCHLCTTWPHVKFHHNRPGGS